MTSSNEATQTVKDYFKSLAEGNLEKLGSLLAEDIIWHQPGNGCLSKTYFGKKEVFELFGRFMNISLGSFKIDHVHHIMANGPYVTATLQFSAKNKSSSISMNGVDVMKIENGKIKEVFLFSADQNAEDNFWKES
jgi:ketosteroid isomerase-like protein